MELMTTLLLLVLTVCIFLCLYRIVMGPTAADRIVAIEMLGTVIVGFCCFVVLRGKDAFPLGGRDFYMNIAISWALLSFIGTIALAKYLEGKAFDE